MTGITAAVAGVILNLAAFFAYHVFWPKGFGGELDSIALLIGLTAVPALFRKAGVIPVIACSGAAGLLLTFLKPWLSQHGVNL
ncbi:hypothetical protein [Methylomonas sp. 2BW1-5-20]|uniref:hypothetical protein n=1 Tax=Methylomonas sp. 2BW1-5-20 TaxID=3376686 RepID=UPI00406DB490